MSARHLRGHGYSPALYARLYGGAAAATPLGAASAAAREAGSRASALSFAAPISAGGALAREVAEELASSPEFTSRLADEVGDALFSGPLRDRIRASLVSVLATRLEMHGQAAARLRAVNDELGEEWRIKAGGEDGGPTKTGDLVGVAHAAVAELRTTEELVVRAVKLALEEQKARQAGGLAPDGAPLDGARYSGKAEVLPVPPDLSAGERETIRNLLQTIAVGVQARRELGAVTVAGRSLPPPPQRTVPSPAGPAEAKAPGTAGIQEAAKEAGGQAGVAASSSPSDF